jgi:hypothetical protein
VALGAVVLIPVGVILAERILAGGYRLKVVWSNALPVSATRATVTRSGLNSLGVADVINLVSIIEVAVVDPVGVLVGEPPRLAWTWPVMGVTVGCFGVSLE